jgi:hypothetical protein
MLVFDITPDGTISYAWYAPAKVSLAARASTLYNFKANRGEGML